MSVKSSAFACALGLLASGMTAMPALAATSTASFGVSAVVESDCLVSAPAATSRVYQGILMNPFSDISVTCSRPTPYTVGLSTGSAQDDSVTSPNTTSPALPSPACTPDSKSPRILDSDQTFVVDTKAERCVGWPRLPDGQSGKKQYTAPGAYADTITVTIAY
jgi:spore coat protein U-like protein